MKRFFFFEIENISDSPLPLFYGGSRSVKHPVSFPEIVKFSVNLTGLTVCEEKSSPILSSINYIIKQFVAVSLFGTRSLHF